jgi:hypothetical protein
MLDKVVKKSVIAISMIMNSCGEKTINLTGEEIYYLKVIQYEKDLINLFYYMRTLNAHTI